MRAVFRPIERWPGELSRQRRDSPFYARLDATWEVLERELEHLRSTEVIVQLDLAEADLRLDGRPRAGVVPGHPGVIVAFESKLGPMQYATDVFTHWHANLRAVALSLEALRKIDRYGVSGRGEQYTGWLALPAPGGLSSRELAAECLLRCALMDAGPAAVARVVDDAEFRGMVYRRAAKNHHPDAGGSVEAFQELETALRAVSGR